MLTVFFSLFLTGSNVPKIPWLPTIEDEIRMVEERQEKNKRGFIIAGALCGLVVLSLYLSVRIYNRDERAFKAFLSKSGFTELSISFWRESKVHFEQLTGRQWEGVEEVLSPPAFWVRGGESAEYVFRIPFRHFHIIQYTTKLQSKIKGAIIVRYGARNADFPFYGLQKTELLDGRIKIAATELAPIAEKLNYLSDLVKLAKLLELFELEISDTRVSFTMLAQFSRFPECLQICRTFIERINGFQFNTASI